MAIRSFATRIKRCRDAITALATARNIGGVSFDGTSDIDLPGVNTAGNQNTSGTAAGLSGSPDINVSNIVGTALTVSGNKLNLE